MLENVLARLAPSTRGIVLLVNIFLPGGIVLGRRIAALGLTIPFSVQRVAPIAPSSPPGVFWCNALHQLLLVIRHLGLLSRFWSPIPDARMPAIARLSITAAQDSGVLAASKILVQRVAPTLALGLNQAADLID